MLMFMKENSHLKDSFNFVKKEAELVAAAEAVDSIASMSKLCPLEKTLFLLHGRFTYVLSFSHGLLVQ